MALVLIGVIVFFIVGVLAIAVTLRRTDAAIEPDINVNAVALDRVAGAQKTQLHMALAHHPNTSPEMLAHLARLADGPVLRAIADRSDTTWEVWQALLAGKDSEARTRAWSRVAAWLAQARWRPAQLFPWQQQQTLAELNQRGRLHLAQLYALQPEVQAEFLRKALTFQLTQTLVHNSDELACAVTMVPAWYALAVQGGLALMKDEPPLGSRLQMELTFLLELVMRELDKALMADVIVIHLLCEVILQRLKQMGDHLRDVEFEQARESKELQRLTALSRRQHSAAQLEYQKAQVAQLTHQVEQGKKQLAGAQALCAQFVACSPVTRLLYAKRCAELLKTGVDRPTGLAVVACHQNALGLQRRLIDELVKTALQADVASWRAVGQLLHGIHTAVSPQPDRQAHFQGLLFILRFLQVFSRNARNPREAFAQRLPPSLADQRTVLSELWQVADMLSRVAAEADPSGGASGQFVREYAQYQDEGHAAWLTEWRQRVEQIRVVGPTTGR